MLLFVSPVLGRVLGGFVGVDFAPLALTTVNFFSSWTAEVLISFSLEANAVLIFAIIANLLKWFTVNCKFPPVVLEGINSIELSSFMWYTSISLFCSFWSKATWTVLGMFRFTFLLLFCNSKFRTLIDEISFLLLISLFLSFIIFVFNSSKSILLVISVALKLISLAWLECSSTLTFWSFDLITTVVVSLLIVSSGSFGVLGALSGLLNLEILPSLPTTTLLPFSESPSIFPVKGLRASTTGVSLGVLNTETLPSLSTTILLPISESPSIFPVKGLRASTTGASLGVLNSETLSSLSITTLLPFLESSSIFPVKGFRASSTGVSLGVLNSETLPSLSKTTLLPF